jgi:cytochrome c oxidase subunit 2
MVGKLGVSGIREAFGTALRVFRNLSDDFPDSSGRPPDDHPVSMSHTAVVITVSYSIALVIGSAIAIAVWRSTLHADGRVDRETWSRRETVWLFVVLGSLFALLLGTIFYVPYGKSAGPNKQVVRVTAVQFAWAIDPPTVKADLPVEFQIGSRDVNHGFGVYDPNGTFVTQVQVVPGEMQKLVWTFKKPGTYKILCLEFCGANHHEMVAELEVKRR